MDIEDLKKPHIHNLFNIPMGSYNLYSFFINWFIYERIFLNSDKDFLKTNNRKQSKHPKNFKNVFLNSIRFFKDLKGKKPLKKVDIIFLSRYRAKNVDNIKTDYLFENVLNYTDDKFDTALISFNYHDRYNRIPNENYNLIDGSTLSIILKSILLSIKILIKFKLVKNELETPLKNVLKTFFSLKNLFFYCLIGLSLNNLFKHLKPQLIVSNDDLQLLKPLNQDAYFITVQSANMQEEIEEVRQQLHSIFVNDERKSDLFCVSGPFFKMIKEKYPADSKEYVITGQTRFDSLFNPFENYPQNLRKKRSTDEKIRILWTTQIGIPDEEKKKNVQAMEKVLLELKNVSLTIKLHPAEDLNTHAKIYKVLEKFDNAKILEGGIDLYQLLSVNDILLTKNSTSVLEAAIAKKNIIILNLSNDDKGKEYVREGIAIGVYDGNKLVSTIKNLIENEKMKKEIEECREQFIYNYNYLNDGNASRRIFENIIKFLNK